MGSIRRRLVTSGITLTSVWATAPAWAAGGTVTLADNITVHGRVVDEQRSPDGFKVRVRADSGIVFTINVDGAARAEVPSVGDIIQADGVPGGSRPLMGIMEPGHFRIVAASSRSAKSNRGLPSTFVVGHGLGGLEIGKPAPSWITVAATAKFGKPLAPGTWGDFEDPTFAYHEKRSIVTFITTLSPMFKTREGIGLGSQLAVVRRAYPGGYETKAEMGHAATYVVTRYGAKTVFSIYAGKVQAIDIGQQ